MITDVEKWHYLVVKIFHVLLFIVNNVSSIFFTHLYITDVEKWHYLVVKNLLGLLKGIASTHEKDFYCLNCFHSFRT